MHTFFINTSQKSLNEYDILFDIHYENRTLVSMDCKMSDWYSSENGYLDCVRKMSEMIDGYSELNNAFNLIIYIDLAENKTYYDIPRDALGDVEREACLQAMRMIYTHAVSRSIVKELEDSGRKPQAVLVMFGEDKKFLDFSKSENNPSISSVEKYLFSFLGMPDNETVESVAKEILNGEAEDKTIAFEEKILSLCSNGLVPDIHKSYTESLHFWCDDVICDKNVEKANEKQVERIRKIDGEHKAESLKNVSCPYDRYACLVNRSEMALKQINIAVYLLRCVEKKTIFKTDNSDGNCEKEVMGFRSYSLDEIVKNLRSKGSAFSHKASEILSTTKSYYDLGLVPELKSFNNLKFGLDEYGGKAFELVVSDAEKKDKDEQENTGAVVSQEEKIVEIKKKSGKILFNDGEFRPFDYKFDEDAYKLDEKNITPERYIEQAKKVRVHHLNYLKKLRIHVSDALSNYAGKSMQNKPALLQMGGFRYTKEGVREEKTFEAVKTVSDKAYETMMNQYMEFCAGRSVEITDIEEQCNWFVSRICQIEESLHKIKMVALGLLIAIIALYVPYFVIQFESLTKSVMTFAVALASVAIPIALLYAVFAFVTAKQKKKYKEVWNEFKKKSDAALAENSEAALKYDQLLTVVIPALRWVYEYKLDVAHYNDCCSIADAKVEHHRRKLRDRVMAINNILADLECSDDDFELQNGTVAGISEAVDYNVSFCSGKNNIAFYSVFDSGFFERSDKN